MVFKINGVNCLPFVDDEGFQWSRNDIESPGAGRTMDGTMQRGRVAIKKRLDVTCRPLTSAESQTLLNLIKTEFVEVTYTDPMDGMVIATMYSNNVPATIMSIDEDGNPLWKGIKFPLVQK